MPSILPAAAFAAVVKRLAASGADAQHMVQHGGAAAQAVGRAVLAALKAGKDDSEAGCKAFLAALAPAADEAGRLAKQGNSRQQGVSKALLAAQHDASAVDWNVKPALGRVTIAAGPGDVQASATAAVVVRTALRRDGDLTAAASCGWAYAGLASATLADVAVFPAGSADSEAAVTVPPQPGMVDPADFSLAVHAPFVGLDPTPPQPVQGRLLPPVVVPTRSVVSVAQGFDAVALSASAPTTATVVLGRTGDTSAALVVPVAVSGLQDGDLAAPVGAASFAPGAPQAGVTLQFGPGTAGAPDRAAHLAIDASGGLFDLGPPGGFDFAVREPAVVVTKGTLTFPSAIGTVIRQATAETTVLVEVAREGVSTHLPASIPAVDIVLPPDVLRVVGPAEFGAGQRVGHAPMVLLPYGAGATGRPSAVRRTPGKAALRATPDFDLGAVPNQDFVVQDGSDVTPPGDGWWKIPGGNLSGKPWNIGCNSTGWTKATAVDLYTKEVGRRSDVYCASNHPGATAASWPEVYAQGDLVNSHSGFGILIACGVKDKTLHLLNIYTHPHNVPLAELVAGKHDAEWVQLGQNLRASWAKSGLSDWQLALRLNKENNQNGLVTNAALYGQAMARFIKAVRQGYGMTSRGRLRISFSPARAPLVGSLEGFCSFDDDGSCLYDTVSVSTHPASQLNGEAGKPPAEQVAAVAAWLRGDFKDGYSYLNAKPDYSVKVLVEKYGLAYSADEWSPRYDGNLYCAISDAAMQALHDFFASIAPRLAWDCVYNANVLSEAPLCPSWPEACRKYKQLWGGG
jgi:hypothetical protein